MSFVIKIQTEAGTTDAVIAHVGKGLDGLETKGKQAGDAITEGMRAASQAAAEAAARVKTVGEAMGFAESRARSAAAATKNAFAGLTEVFQREHDMLERIHGPMRQHEADMRSIDALYRRGSVSAHQYAEEVARITKNGQGAGVLHGPIRQMPGAGVSGPAMMPAGESAMAGLVTKAGAAYVAKEILDLGDSYINLQNRLRQVAGSQENLNVLMARTHEIADATRSDWRTTAEGYVRLTQATKQMGLSQERGLKITETLNMALQSSGASASEASAGTLQLMQALAAGALQGDEFRSISENIPVLMDVLAKQLHVTRGELKAMGADGKITADVIIKGMEAASGSIHENFAKSTATASQQWVVFKNQLVETAGKFVESSHIVEILGNTLKGLGAVLGPVGSALGSIVGIMGTVGGAAQSLGHAVGVDLKIGLGTFVGFIAGGPVGAALGTLAEGLIRSRSMMDDLKDAVEATERAQDGLLHTTGGLSAAFSIINASTIKMNGGWFATESALGAVDAAFERTLSLLNKTTLSLAVVNGLFAKTKALFTEGFKIGELMDRYRSPGTKIADELKEIADLQRARKISGSEAIEMYEEIERRRKAALPKGSQENHDGQTAWRGSWVTMPTRGHGGSGPAKFSLTDGLMPGAAANDNSKGVDNFLDAQRMGMRNNLVEWAQHRQMMLDGFEATKKWHDELNKTNELAGVLGQTLLGSVGSFTSTLIDAAAGADVSWSKFFGNLATNIAKAVAEAAALNLLTGSVTGARGAGVHGGFGGLLGLFGGANGFDAMVPGGSGPFLPGFARGGNATVTGSGGTDSKIAAFRITPGETLAVRTPAQQREEADAASDSGGSSPAVPAIANHIHFDPRALLPMLNTPDGRQAIRNVIRLDIAMIAALLKNQ